MVYPSAYVSTCRHGYLPTCVPADVATTQLRAYVSPTAYLSPTIRHTGAPSLTLYLRSWYIYDINQQSALAKGIHEVSNFMFYMINNVLYVCTMTHAFTIFVCVCHVHCSVH